VCVKRCVKYIKTIKYFTANLSTVSVCALDISKDFDKVNHTLLYAVLMERNAPAKFILMLSCWYDNGAICVRCGSYLSRFVTLSSGVCQGGVLSHFIFIVYVDIVLVKLRKSGLGCYIKGFCFNCVMYADDLMLLAVSVSDMQKMINLCCSVLGELELQMNVSKSVCLRIEPRHSIINFDLKLA